jgi:biotin carboxyl carrier protein
MEGGRPPQRVEKRMKYTATIDGTRIDLEIVHANARTIEAKVAGQVYQIDRKDIAHGVFWFNWNNRSVDVSITAQDDTYIVALNGRPISVEIEDPRTALRKAAHHGHSGAVELRAPMPGKVVKVLLQEGAEVHANQGILIIEAMKMQNEIKSPKSGKVKRLSVQETAAVNAGELLAVVE